MITPYKADSGNKLLISEDHYGGKISAYLKAYGTEYDFCRFYTISSEASQFSAMLFNANMVLCGEIGDSEGREELEILLSFAAPLTVEAPFEISCEGYSREKVLVMSCKEAHPSPYNDMFITSDNCDFSLYSVRNIIAESFDISADMWYTDMSHRIRRGISYCAALDIGGVKAAGAVDFTYGRNAYLSDICVLPDCRGQGFGRKIVEYLSQYAIGKGLCPIVRTRESNVDFYRKCGFEIVWSEGIYTKKL